MSIIFFGDWWHRLTFAEQIFWTIAIIFSVLFLLQMAMSIIGMEMDSDVDFQGDFDSGDTGGHFDVDPGFTLFSIRGIIAFFTFFGWVGVISLYQGLEVKTAVIVAFIAGLIALVFVAFVLYQLAKLAEEGTVHIDEALGKYGTVYIPIPAERSGVGMVHIEMGGKTMELRAVTDGKTLPTGTLIYVFKVLNDNILLVGEIKDKDEY